MSDRSIFRVERCEETRAAHEIHTDGRRPGVVDLISAGIMSNHSRRAKVPVNAKRRQVGASDKTLGDIARRGQVLTFPAARSNLFHRSAANSQLSGYALSLSLSGNISGRRGTIESHGGWLVFYPAVRIAPIRILRDPAESAKACAIPDLLCSLGTFGSELLDKASSFNLSAPPCRLPLTSFPGLILHLGIMYHLPSFLPSIFLSFSPCVLLHSLPSILSSFRSSWPTTSS